jgi:hypothetical protein
MYQDEQSGEWDGEDPDPQEWTGDEEQDFLDNITDAQGQCFSDAQDGF